jgi:hypothetical protein
LVIDVAEPFWAGGSLRLRDGLPIADPAGSGHIVGALPTFGPGQGTAAYGRVSDMEPDRHYRWHEAQVNGVVTNMLIGTCVPQM